MKVKPPFITYENASHTLASLVVIKIRTFSSAHPEGKLSLGSLYVTELPAEIIRRIRRESQR